MTASTTGFYGRNYVDAVEALQDNILRPNSTKLVEELDDIEEAYSKLNNLN